MIYKTVGLIFAMHLSFGGLCQKAEPIVIPFEYVDGWMFVNVKMNDTIEGRFLYDTGSPTTLDNSLADKLYGASSGDSFKGTGVGEGSQFKVRFIPKKLKLSTNGYSKTQVAVFAANIKHSMQYGKVDGIIGLNFFENKIIEVNFDSCYFRITKSIQTPTNSYRALPTKVSREYFLPIDIFFEQQVLKGFFKFDTGSRNRITLYSGIIKTDVMQNEIQVVAHSESTGGLGGVSIKETIRANRIRMGTDELSNVLIGYSKDKSGALNMKSNPSQQNELGLVGLGIISKFNWILDFKNKKFYAKPNGNFSKTDSTIVYNITIGEGSNSTMLVKGKSKVKGTQHYFDNINVGDTVLSVANLSIHTIPIQRIIDSLPTLVNQPIELIILKNGNPLTLRVTLERFILEDVE